MFTLWRICSKLVDRWDTEDKRSTRDMPLLLLVLGVIAAATVISMGIGYLAGEDPWPHPIP